MIFDAGFLISVDRGEEAARALLTAVNRSHTQLHTTHAVAAQVWRDGANQARLASFLKTTTIHPLDDGRAIGQLLALSHTTDVVDAHLVVLALRLGDDILTGDPDDIGHIADTLGARRPYVRPWP